MYEQIRKEFYRLDTEIRIIKRFSDRYLSIIVLIYLYRDNELHIDASLGVSCNSDESSKKQGRFCLCKTVFLIC